MSGVITWTDWLAERLRAVGSPYAPFYHGKLETQIQPVQDDDLLDRYGSAWPIVGTVRPVRTVKTTDDGAPIRSNDGIVDFHPELIGCAATSWWNWVDQLTEACFFDFDYGHGGKALDAAGIARVDEWSKRLPYVLNVTSKSGRGRHWLVRLTAPQPAPTRVHHSHNCKRIKAKIDADLGFDLGPSVCSFGTLQYIWSR